MAMRILGELESAVSEGVNRFEQEYMGRGPKNIRAHLLGDPEYADLGPGKYARWSPDGSVDPRPGDGAVLQVDDFVYTVEDLREARATSRGRPRPHSGSALESPPPFLEVARP